MGNPRNHLGDYVGRVLGAPKPSGDYSELEEGVSSEVDRGSEVDGSSEKKRFSRRKLLGMMVVGVVVVGGALAVNYSTFRDGGSVNKPVVNYDYTRVSLDDLTENPERWEGMAIETQFIPGYLKYSHKDRYWGSDYFIPGGDIFRGGDINNPCESLQIFPKRRGLLYLFYSYQENSKIFEEAEMDIQKCIKNKDPIIVKGFLRKLPKGSCNTFISQTLTLQINGEWKTYQLSDNPEWDYLKAIKGGGGENLDKYVY